MNTQTQPSAATRSGALHSIAFLEQGLTLLRQINDEQYGTKLPPVFSNGVGAHMRHILDHYECLLAGFESGRVDYDCRKRSELVEQDRSVAIEAINDIMSRLSSMSDHSGDTPLLVNMDSNDDSGEWSESSLSREFQFLSSHTIHHYAIIAAILNQAGCTLSPGFGISPSTLRHHQT
ncbi:MAG: DinB family protein [Gammaproteobacteria bacterium]